MRLTPRRLLFGIILIAVLIQFFRPDRSNPPEVASQTIEANLEISPGVKATLGRSCMDCHSNRTVWPWYSNIAPVSWVISSDVSRGRAHMNFSDWASYGNGEKDELLDHMCREVTRGDMPESQYTMIHRDAVLQDSQVAAICDWTKKARQSIQAGD